jgi:hypothetical protein
MKNVFLIGAASLLLAGCETYHTAGTGEYSYSYDLGLPTVSGTQAEMQAALNEAPVGYTVAVPSTTSSTTAPAQSVVFYEGKQPAQTVVAGAAPVWTAPAASTATPAAVPGPGVPLNEPAGATPAAAAPGAAAGVAGAAVEPAPAVLGGGFVGGGFVGSDGVVGDGSAVRTNTGININNNNSNSVVFQTNALTNVAGGITNTNGTPTNSFVNTNANVTNVALTNPPSTTSNGIAQTPAGGGTNNQNNLPRAPGATVGTPPGTQLVPNRPIGEPAGAQISPNPNVPAGSVQPSNPTQPGPSTSPQGTTGTQQTTPQVLHGTSGGVQGPNQNRLNPQTTPTPSQWTTTTPQGTVPPQNRTLLRNGAPAPAATPAPAQPAATPR